MSSTVVSLVIAVVAVCGTLASAILTQRSAQHTKFKELEHGERVRHNEQAAAEKLRRTEQLRNCYVQLNANDRHYRDALLAYAYALKEGSPGNDEAAEVAAARRAQRDARAEAQMTASSEVLRAEGPVNLQLTKAYRSLKLAEKETDERVHSDRLEDVIGNLDVIIDQLSQVRMIMRMELGVTDEPE